MEPPPASSIMGSTARVRRMTAVTLTANTRSQVASSTSAGGRKASMIPATFARASTRPLAAATTACGGFGGDVPRDRDQVEIGELGEELVQAVGRDVGGHDAGALPGQTQGGGPADAGTGAGHDHSPAGEAAGSERRSGVRWAPASAGNSLELDMAASPCQGDGS